MGLARIEFVEMERNGQIWDVLEFGQYRSELKDLRNARMRFVFCLDKGLTIY